jgi:hypothetical protein
MDRFGGRAYGMQRTATIIVASTLMLCALPQTAPAQGLPAVAGSVRYYSNDQPVADVAVQLSGLGVNSASTDAAGAYAFSDPGPGSWQVTPFKSGGFNDGISALDASHVLQAVVGLRQFTTYQLLACDVTGDGTISSLDAARILQFVAGMRDHFPVSDACGGSDWVFVPSPAGAPNQQLIEPVIAPQCSFGSVVYNPLVPPAVGQDFVAIMFGDCTGNWQPAGPADTPTSTPLPNSTDTPPPVPTATASSTATATRTLPPTLTGTSTVSSTATRTASVTWTPTRTYTPTAPVTATWTRTSTRTATSTWTSTRTQTLTRTATATSTVTASYTGTPTRTGTRTNTPVNTFTVTPTPTPPCAHGLAWAMSAPHLISAQAGGNLWLAKSVSTSSGWGLFWLRQDPGAPNIARLYYAHVDFAGQITAGPQQVVDIPKIDFRGHYYFVAWNEDHYGLTVSSQSTLYYYNVSLAGVASGKKTLAVPLFVSTVYDQESDGDLDAFPGGFVGVVEGDCAGHSCSYAYKLDVNGGQLTSPINLVDFDFTHQFYPRAAFDGSGFAILSVKDIDISNGGVVTKYLPLSGAISSHAKVVPAKQYLWDEFPDVASNGDHFAAVWTENSARSDTAPWQIHFASFRRTKTSSTLIGERVIDMVAQKTNQRWTTQIHAVGGDWVAQYATRAADNSISAVYELLGDDGQTHAALEPFTLLADALGSSPHTAAGHVGELGIVRGSNLPQGGTEITFQTLPAPACAP